MRSKPATWLPNRLSSTPETWELLFQLWWRSSWRVPRFPSPVGKYLSARLPYPKVGGGGTISSLMNSGKRDIAPSCNQFETNCIPSCTQRERDNMTRHTNTGIRLHTRTHHTNHRRGQTRLKPVLYHHSGLPRRFAIMWFPETQIHFKAFLQWRSSRRSTNPPSVSR